MATNYDEIGDDFKQTERNLFRTYIEKPTVFSVLKGVRAKSMLDLACGDGNYTRTIKEQGAALVVGIDISEKMIANARMAEEQQPLGIEYLVRDVAKLEQIGSFDLATAIYLFPYAQTEQTLVDMSQAVYNNLKAEGRLVAAVTNPDISEKHIAAFKKYGIHLEIENPLRDGAQIVVNIFIESGPLRILNTYWSRETYERVLKKVGFQKIEWHSMHVSAEGIEKYGESYWQEYLATPAITVLEAYK